MLVPAHGQFLLKLVPAFTTLSPIHSSKLEIGRTCAPPAMNVSRSCSRSWPNIPLAWPKLVNNNGYRENIQDT